MNIRKLEKELYNDEEFLKCLPILKEENWKKATAAQRMKIFKEIQRVVANVDNYFPTKIIKEKDLFEELIYQNIAVCRDIVAIKEELLTKTYNPYVVITNYMLELAIEKNYSVCDAPNKAKSEKEKMFVVNYACSMFGEWNNHFDRQSKNFFFQPIVSKASDDAQLFTYDLLKYMHKKYGMDNYIGEQVSNLMTSSFDRERRNKIVDENYKVMAERFNKINEEVEKLNELIDYCNENIKEENSEFLFSLFNYKVICNLDDDFRVNLYKWFCKTTLQGYSELDEILNSISIVKDEEGNNILIVGNKGIIADEGYEINGLMEYIASLKIANDLLWEIEDEKLKSEAKECFKYFMEIKDDNDQVECDYMGKAFAYTECRTALINYYNDVINENIKKNEIFNDGYSSLQREDDSKMEAFLQFTFDKSYDEVRKLQFDALKEKVVRKGGR